MKTMIKWVIDDIVSSQTAKALKYLRLMNPETVPTKYKMELEDENNKGWDAWIIWAEDIPNWSGLT